MSPLAPEPPCQCPGHRHARRQISGWLSRASVVAAALVSALAPTSPHGQGAARIDGSSVAGFEASVARLQNELAPQNREDFEIALAVIWIANIADSSDVDRDGDVDVEDGRMLKEDALDLLTDIRRGDLLAAVEKRERSGADYGVTDYFRQLDGLGYDEVLALAGRPSRPYLALLRQYRAEALCPRQPGPPKEQSVVRKKWCDAFSGPTGQVIGASGKALNTAIEALRAYQYAQARAALARISHSPS